ncbi:hypothetical protein HID58_029029 [Brassica napus]|uniref:Uncharacterized protein n=1 Tax=Brassica napus TaxID=3708 RepID=A0ABQ8CBZ9_BRANA|nr:hypothetical protein HID58_029029 [Brassica napus]
MLSGISLMARAPQKEAFFAFHLSCAGEAQSQSQGTVKLHRVAHSLAVVELVYHLRTQSSSFAYRSWNSNHCRPELSRQKQSKSNRLPTLTKLENQGSSQVCGHLIPSCWITSSELTAHWKHEYFIRPNSPVSINKSIHVYTHYGDKFFHPYVHWGDKSLEAEMRKLKLEYEKLGFHLKLEYETGFV